MASGKGLGKTAEQVRQLIAAFLNSGKEKCVIEVTCKEVEELKSRYDIAVGALKEIKYADEEVWERFPKSKGTYSISGDIATKALRELRE